MFGPIGTKEAFAAFDIARAKEDRDDATDADSDRRWHAGVDAFRAPVNDAADALVLIARLRSSDDITIETAASLTSAIRRGVTPADLPDLRRQIAVIRDAAIADDAAGWWADQLIDGTAGLARFLFEPKLIAPGSDRRH